MSPLVPCPRMASDVVRAIAAGAAFAACAGPALAGPDWDRDLYEDALQSATTAQVVSAGPTPVMLITGRLTGYGIAGGDFVDMYQISVTNDTLVSISTAGGDLGGSANFDTQLFLFRRKGGNGGNIRAAAFKGNDNAALGNPGSRIGENENPTSNSILLRKGTYYVAVTGVGTSAFGDNGQAIWGNLGNPGATISGNDVFLNDWAGEGAVGEYSIRIQSLSGGMIPSPGAVALLALGAIAVPRRRR